MPMNTQVQLPAPLSEYVQSQVAAGRYGSAEEFVSALVRADQEEQRILAQLENNPRLERLLEEGLESGPGRIWNSDVLEEHKQRILARAKTRRVGP
jgi:antitoxin ParD1/3/4